MDLEAIKEKVIIDTSWNVKTPVTFTLSFECPVIIETLWNVKLDKNILVEYADLKEEIKDLRRRIELGRRELEKLEQLIVTDSVIRGKKGKKPLGTVKVTGIPSPMIVRKKSAQKKRISDLERLETELLELTNQVEEYIETIPKSKLRMIFRFYYIDDLTWEMVAMNMNYAHPKKNIPFTGDNCRMAHDRFLEKSL